MDEARITRIAPSGDPFTAAPGPGPEQDHPHACVGGYIYLGYSAVDEETGDEVERVEALPCRRCEDSRAYSAGP